MTRIEFGKQKYLISTSLTKQKKEQKTELAIPFLNTVQCGDSSTLLKQIPNNTIDLVITSPPYFQQRDYGGGIGNEKLVNDYIDAVLEVFHECVRIIKNTGSIVFNIGDKFVQNNLLLIPYIFAHEAIKKENVKLINNITWVKTNPTPRQFKRRLVSSTEPFFHFAKTDQYFYDIDNYQAELKQSKSIQTRLTKTKSHVGKSYISLIKKSNLSKSEKKNALKALNEVIQEVHSNKIHSFRMKIRGVHSPAFGGQSGGRTSQLLNNGYTIIKITGNKMKSDVIKGRVESIKWNRHPAIYPEYIINELIKLLTKKNNIVLDPYLGSGTSAVCAKHLGRNYIGIDINPEFCRNAINRIMNNEK